VHPLAPVAGTNARAKIVTLKPKPKPQNVKE
jgi:hypothetical protein